MTEVLNLALLRTVSRVHLRHRPLTPSSADTKNLNPTSSRGFKSHRNQDRIVSKASSYILPAVRLAGRACRRLAVIGAVYTCETNLIPLPDGRRLQWLRRRTLKLGLCPSNVGVCEAVHHVGGYMP